MPEGEGGISLAKALSKYRSVYYWFPKWDWYLCFILCVREIFQVKNSPETRWTLTDTEQSQPREQSASSRVYEEVYIADETA